MRLGHVSQGPIGDVSRDWPVSRETGQCLARLSGVSQDCPVSQETRELTRGVLGRAPLGNLKNGLVFTSV